MAAAIGSKLYIWGGYRANCKLSDNVLDELDSYQKSVVEILGS